MTGAITKRPATQVCIEPAQAQRRIDNYLIGHYKNIPKSRIYQMIRRGEVRVNGCRIRQTYRLQPDDKVRLPPLHFEARKASPPLKAQHTGLHDRILYEDNALLILNKPAGLAVHSGSKQSYGVIDILRTRHSGGGKLELVHRLDKPTSGCLIIAKDVAALRILHTDIRDGRIHKTYAALLCGRLPDDHYAIEMRLDSRCRRFGERRVEVTPGGRQARSDFVVQRRYADATQVTVRLLTGRTHQIRAHARHLGHPVIGDCKYGDKACNKKFRSRGLKGLFLHAASLQFRSPDTDKTIVVAAPLPDNLAGLLRALESPHPA